MEETEQFLDAARVQFASFGDAPGPLHEDAGEQRRVTRSLHDCSGNTLELLK